MEKELQCLKNVFQYRGRDMNDNYVYGFLTKKKNPSTGEISWAIATGDCSPDETILISDNFAPIIGRDDNGDFICDGDVIIFLNGVPLAATLAIVLVDIYGNSYAYSREAADKYGQNFSLSEKFNWFFGDQNRRKF